MNELTKQIIFDCAMELMYHAENKSDKEIVDRLLNLINEDDDFIRGHRAKSIIDDWSDLNCMIDQKQLDEILKPFMNNKDDKN